MTKRRKNPKAPKAQMANIGFQDIAPQFLPHDQPPVDPVPKANKPDYGVVTAPTPGMPYPAPTPENPPMRTAGESSINTARVTLSVRMRFNPLRNLTPARLVQYLDQFDLGFFRMAAVAWDRIERRDPVVKTVSGKRKKAVSRHGFDILTVDNVPTGMESLAEQQVEALTNFYNNLTAVDAIRPDQQGGINLLSRQMMDAHSKYYAVHEIVWQPKPSGLTAQFVACPLWWFEGATGKLRYLDNEFMVYGRDMASANWMVTVGEGLMEACSVAYIYKTLSLQDWVAMSEKFGTPFLDAATSAAPGSDEWEALVAYVQNYGPDGGGVRSNNSVITPISPNANSVEMFQAMVANMDRAMTILWRGGDLGTTSSKNANGASLQGDESAILESDDAAMIEETLAIQVSRYVINWTFGPDAPVLAYLKFKQAEQQNVAQDLAIDTFLVNNGAPLSIKDTLERYGRAVPDSTADLLKPAIPPGGTGPAESNDPPEIANDDPSQPTLEDTAHTHFAMAVAADLQPIRERIAALLQIDDDAIFAQRAQDLASQIAKLQKDICQLPKCAQVLAETQIAALFSGLTSGKSARTAQMANGDLPGHQFHGNQHTGPLEADKQKEIIRSVVKRSEDPQNQKGEDFGAVSPIAIDKAKNALDKTGKPGGVDLTGFSKRIEPDAVRHGTARHSNPDIEISRNQSPISAADYEQLPDILDNPDKVTRAGNDKDGNARLIFEKKTTDGYRTLVDVRRGKQKLAIKHLIKERKEA